MAIIDKQLIFSDEQAVPTTTTETNSTDVHDLTAAGRNIGEGIPAYLNIQVAEGVTHAGALNVTFRFYSHTAADVKAGTAHLEFTVAKAGLEKGTLFRLPVPIPEEIGRFIGVSYECSATTATAGKFNAWIDLG